MTPLEAARSIHQSLPQGGLFHEKEWRIAPRPFALPDDFAAELEKLGHPSPSSSAPAISSTAKA